MLPTNVPGTGPPSRSNDPRERPPKNRTRREAGPVPLSSQQFIGKTKERSEVSSLERLGWNAFFEQQLTQLGDEVRQQHLWARIVEEQRGLYRIAGDAEGWAEVSGRFRHDARAAADFPAVGDWIGATPGSRAIIHHRLKRRSTI